MLADALAERGKLSGAKVDALIGGGSTPATAAGSSACIRMVNPKQLRARVHPPKSKQQPKRVGDPITVRTIVTGVKREGDK